jgi:membrane protease subunit HflK
MSRKAEHICIGGLVLQVLFALGAFALATATNSRAAFAEAWHYAAGAGLWLVALLHLTFRRLAAEERLDEEAIRRRRGERAEGIFGPEGAADEFSAQARLVRIERWFVPVGTLVFAVGMIVLSALMAAGWGKPVERLGGTLGGLAAFAAMALLAFVLGRYALGQSQEEASALLRGPAGYTLFNALCSAAVAIALAFGYFGAAGVERVVAWVIIAALGLIGVELVLVFVFNLYRPRRAGREARAPYDSRLLALLSMPRGILRSAGLTLDYQFGFKVSETWFFRFLERALAPLILFGLLTLYLLTCFVVVPPGHLAFIERFGKPRAAQNQAPQPLHPGLHFKWPWPVEVARTVAAARVQEFVLGVSGQEQGRAEYERKIARGEKAEMPPAVWTTPHFEQEYNLLVATNEPVKAVELTAGGTTIQVPPVSLLVVSIPVQFVVREAELYKYVYSHSDVAETLEAVAYRELVRYVAGVDLISILGPGRAEAGDELRRRFQAAADEAGLGVDIVFVGLHGVHPPVAVAPSFEARVTALEERKAEILQGQTHAIGLKPKQEAEQARIVGTAKAERFSTRTLARADAERFVTLDAIDRAAARVFRLRRFLIALEELLPGKGLVLAPAEAQGQEVVIIDLEEKVGSELLNVGLGPVLEREREREKQSTGGGQQ